MEKNPNGCNFILKHCVTVTGSITAAVEGSKLHVRHNDPAIYFLKKEKKQSLRTLALVERRRKES